MNVHDVTSPYRCRFSRFFAWFSRPIGLLGPVCGKF